MPTADTAVKPSKAKARPARRKPARGKAAASAGAPSRAAGAKSTSPRSSGQGENPVKQVQTATRDTAVRVGDYAERAVLIPVGAALIARDRVVSTVSDTFSTYSSSTKTQQQLRRFERRGATARNRLEREVRKARVRFERELRQRRRSLEGELRQRRRSLDRRFNDIDGRRDSITRNGSDLANRVQERILNLV
jgi:hypothetical protein